MIRRSRAFSLLEVLLTLSLLGLLLFAIGNVLAHVLDSTQLGQNRSGLSQSADELASRLTSEARSSTAVFVPATDIMGQANGGSNGAHEVDFFRKESDGTLSYVAYRFDASAGVVDRFDYQPTASGPAQIIDQDRMANDVSGFAAAKASASSIPGIVGGQSIKPVNIYYGTPELVGGNGIVTVSFSAGSAGEPKHTLTVHLASRAAPTDVSILVGARTPNPSPSPSQSPVTVGFVLQRPNIHPPHGPNQQGNPGGSPGGRPGTPGFAVFLGNGSGDTQDWMDMFSMYPVVQTGVYQFRDSNGNSETAVITCADGPCPPFIPLPVPTLGPAVVFQTVN